MTGGVVKEGGFVPGSVASHSPAPVMFGEPGAESTRGGTESLGPQVWAREAVSLSRSGEEPGRRMVTLTRSADESLGLLVAPTSSSINGRALKVDAVPTGAAMRWNERGSGLPLQIGDRIVEVNGESDTCSMLHKLYGDLTVTLTIEAHERKLRMPGGYRNALKQRNDTSWALFYYLFSIEVDVHKFPSAWQPLVRSALRACENLKFGVEFCVAVSTPLLWLLMVFAMFFDLLGGGELLPRHSIPILVPVLLYCLHRAEVWARPSIWKYTQSAQIAMVKVGAVRNWCAVQKPFPRRQNLESHEYVVPTGKEKCRYFVVSHPWLSAEHPDKCLFKLHSLVDALLRLDAEDEDLVFFDYCSLFQDDKTHPEWEPDLWKRDSSHPALRTPEQRALFKAGLGQMELMYTSSPMKVIVLPDVPDGVRSSIPYCNRGWCFFELSCSADYGRIAKISPDVETMLEDMGMPLSPAAFTEMFSTKSFTDNGDRKVVLNMYSRLFRQRTCPSIKLTMVFLVPFISIILFVWLSFFLIYWDAYSDA